MRILVVGSGGREHALLKQLAKSTLAKKIFVAPGNGGTQKIAENINIAADNIAGLADFAAKEKIDLVVPGPELPLTLGITDAMEKANIPCFGPNAYCAQLESSKSFAKQMMQKANIPTAKSKVFTDMAKAREYAKNAGRPLVIKADGLAQGKGVIIAETQKEALDAVDSMASFGNAGSVILIEEKLTGEEVSLLCLCDGKIARPLPSAQDHKAILDGDKGPNTGGMGAYSPAPILPDSHLEEMTKLAVQPMLNLFNSIGQPFKGILYAGLMITENGPYVLEYNVRFGDPECQAILPRMQSDLAKLMLACTNGTLASEDMRFTADACLGVVIAANGYPGKYPKDLPITGIDKAEQHPGVQVFHSGTKMENSNLVSSGGRVLCVTALAENLEKAKEKAYKAINQIEMPEKYIRTDIGNKGIERLNKEKKQQQIKITAFLN